MSDVYTTSKESDSQCQMYIQQVRKVTANVRCIYNK